MKKQVFRRIFNIAELTVEEPMAYNASIQANRPKGAEAAQFLLDFQELRVVTSALIEFHGYNGVNG